MLGVMNHKELVTKEKEIEVVCTLGDGPVKSKWKKTMQTNTLQEMSGIMNCLLYFLCDGIESRGRGPRICKRAECIDT